MVEDGAEEEKEGEVVEGGEEKVESEKESLLFEGEGGDMAIWCIGGKKGPMLLVGAKEIGRNSDSIWVRWCFSGGERPIIAIDDEDDGDTLLDSWEDE